jgi:hypothetical protein
VSSKFSVTDCVTEGALKDTVLALRYSSATCGVGAASVCFHENYTMEMLPLKLSLPESWTSAPARTLITTGLAPAVFVGL